MRSRSRAGSIALAGALTLLPMLSARAQEGTMPDWANKNGAVGLGMNTTMGGTNGITFRTYVSPLFGIQGTIGFNVEAQTDKGNPADTYSFSSTMFAVGLYATYKIAYWQRGSLAVIFGGDLESVSTTVDPFGSDTETNNSTTNVILGMGLQGEWFPTQYLSLFLQTGIQLDFLGDDDVFRVGGATATDPGVSGIDLTFGGDLLGAAGVVVWFK